VPVVVLLLTPLLLLGAAVSGLATGGALSNLLGQANADLEERASWFKALVGVALVAVVLTTLWTLPRLFALTASLFSTGASATVLLVRELVKGLQELTPW